jgi:hypothetical protein
VQDDGSLVVDFGTATREQMASLKSIEIEERTIDSTAAGVRKVKISMSDKRQALMDLAKIARLLPGPSQTWKAFLRNHAAGIAAMDFLIVPTVGFKLLFVLVILRHQRRRLISLRVTSNPTAEWIAHQLTDAFPWNEAPDYLIRDRDGSYGHAPGVLQPWVSVITR